jgi:hypothetical protein
VREGSAELLLGWSYVDLGVGQVGTPSYFVLTRGERLAHVAAPPVAPKGVGPMTPTRAPGDRR